MPISLKFMLSMSVFIVCLTRNRMRCTSFARTALRHWAHHPFSSRMNEICSHCSANTKHKFKRKQNAFKFTNDLFTAHRDIRINVLKTRSQSYPVICANVEYLILLLLTVRYSNVLTLKFND